ncbi:holo-ACP synthase [Levilactobacillus huananensis]|uniref:holo-ACP synthase n=1 Tax=Levilactobacillus huananensis TaxID=2486019 RepID=UPI000F7B725D|nr:holo-ACP synthase [Levilactobacillus huananensis]
MIYGIGIDITDLDRVAKVVAKQPKFLEKVLTPNEMTDYRQLSQRRAVEFIGGRWSAKESYSKAMGTGIGSAVGFQDVEIRDNAQGQPVITRQPFEGIAHVSISHTDSVVMTEVILERG